MKPQASRWTPFAVFALFFTPALLLGARPPREMLIERYRSDFKRQGTQVERIELRKMFESHRAPGTRTYTPSPEEWEEEQQVFQEESEGKADRARERLEQMFEHYPASPFVRLHLVDCLLSHEQRPAAEKFVQRAAERFPSAGDLILMQAGFERMRGVTGEAARAATQSLLVRMSIWRELLQGA